jgi:hypothetical protein
VILFLSAAAALLRRMQEMLSTESTVVVAASDAVTTVTTAAKRRLLTSWCHAAYVGSEGLVCRLLVRTGGADNWLDEETIGSMISRLHAMPTP